MRILKINVVSRTPVNRDIMPSNTLDYLFLAEIVLPEIFGFIADFREVIGDRKVKKLIGDRPEITTYSTSDRLLFLLKLTRHRLDSIA